MVVLMSNWSESIQSVPENYVLPQDQRPGKHDFPVFKNLPVIDLENTNGHDGTELIQQIFNASQEFGIFQVTNHGIPVSLMDDAMSVYKEFFAMRGDYKSSFYSKDLAKKCRIFSSTLNYDNEEVHYWRDNFTHHCYPLEDEMHLWPENPNRYREVVGAYSSEVRKLMLRILDLIGEGLELKPGYFGSELSKLHVLSVNHHIPCPDPTLTLGMHAHSDPNLISSIHQGSVPGLQVLVQGQWMDVEPAPGALIVITGLQLKIISNEKISSPIHRVMTHSKEARTTIGTFLIPSQDITIEPAKDCAGDAPIYRGFEFKEFFSTFTRSNCDAGTALRYFKTE